MNHPMLHSNDVISSISLSRRFRMLGSSLISTPGPTGLEVLPFGNTYVKSLTISDNVRMQT